MVDFLNYSEARELAKAKLPRGIFEFVDRGTGDEFSLRHNRRQFEAARILPRVLTGGSPRSQKVEIFGETYSAPMLAAPTAFAGLVWFKGEIELARAAAAYGIPFCAATEAITGVGEIATAVGTPIWFQLYLWDREELSQDLIEKAWTNGARTLVVTVDTPVLPKREYNVRNGFDIPFRFSPRNVFDVATHPRWAVGVLGRYLAAGGLPNFANYPPEYRSNILSRGSARSMSLAPDLDWDCVRRIRTNWKGNLVIKGILRADDALLALKIGADGIIVSNHGGRNLDGAVAPIEVLPDIADAVGDRLTVLADSSVQRGSDIFKLLASGAKAVLLGRSLLYGTAIAGSAGALRMMRNLGEELDVAMAMSGCRSLGEIDRSLLAKA